MSLVFKPLLAQFLRRSKPDRLILEPSGLSHPAKVVDILRSEGFANTIELGNIICLIDPKIDRCREWVEGFNPPKALILETSFGEIQPSLLDQKFGPVRMPLFADAHQHAADAATELAILPSNDSIGIESSKPSELIQPAIGEPIRFQNDTSEHVACGWIFHLDEVFNRKKLVDFLDATPSVLRLKGIFHCDANWWAINRAKDTTTYTESTWRRDSRLEIIVEDPATDWQQFESMLFECKTVRR